MHKSEYGLYISMKQQSGAHNSAFTLFGNASSQACFPVLQSEIVFNIQK